MNDIPLMPTIAASTPIHREKNPREGYVRWPALIARKVGFEERMRIPKAKKACDDEWSKLFNAGPKGCFDMSKVEEK